MLLYAHYDVQPPLDDDAWRTPPFELTEVDGRWYGRGAADCKGNIVMHLAALRALGDDVPVDLKLVVEGSEEQGTGGLEAFVPANADLLRADTILVCDTGNASVGHPAATVSLRGMVNVVVTVEAQHLGDPLRDVRGAGSRRPRRLVAMLATCVTSRATPRSRAWTTPAGRASVPRSSCGSGCEVLCGGGCGGGGGEGHWNGAPYPPEQFRADAGVLEGVSCSGTAACRTCCGRDRR